VKVGGRLLEKHASADRKKSTAHPNFWERNSVRSREKKAQISKKGKKKQATSAGSELLNRRKENTECHFPGGRTGGEGWQPTKNLHPSHLFQKKKGGEK